MSPNKACVETKISKPVNKPKAYSDKLQTIVVPRCLKTYDLSEICKTMLLDYSSITWIDKNSFALADKLNQTAIIVNNARGKIVVHAHSVKEIVSIAFFNDYIACKTWSADIVIYSYPDWNQERTFKGAFAISSRSSELIWVTKNRIMIFTKNSLGEKIIKDEKGKPFKFQKPYHFCCLPNESFALTDRFSESLYVLDQRGHISARLTPPGELGALSCDKDNRIYMTCYESNSVSIFHMNGSGLRIVSLRCILDRPKTISVQNEEAILIANKYDVVLLSLK